MENNEERQQVELNHRLIELNSRLIDVNREQTKKCRHLLGGVRLLEDLYIGAELCECAETGQRRFTVSTDEWERVAVYLADFAAANESLSAAGRSGGDRCAECMKSEAAT